MRDGEIDGMQDFDTVIRQLIESQAVTLEDGLSYATNQNNLLLQLNGLGSTEDYLTQQSQMSSGALPPMPKPTGSFVDLME